MGREEGTRNRTVGAVGRGVSHMRIYFIHLLTVLTFCMCVCVSMSNHVYHHVSSSSSDFYSLSVLQYFVLCILVILVSFSF